MTESRKWERARKPEQIESRRQDILSAATALIDEVGVEAAGHSAIARACGLSKANLYRYFESREAILLAIFIEELKLWTGSLAETWDAIEEKGDVALVAQLYADSLKGRDRFRFS